MTLADLLLGHRAAAATHPLGDAPDAELDRHHDHVEVHEESGGGRVGDQIALLGRENTVSEMNDVPSAISPRRRS